METVEVGWEAEHKAGVNDCYSHRVTAADNFERVIYLYAKTGIGNKPYHCVQAK
jgi:hypothetical protein